ncbi:hypothetical protein, partial [Tardiphaga sp.]|uniref:hypothetical protein n=1 Tax=Tardiphaga sp. TaxID=1926292 RepID=UPI0037DA5DD2
MVQNLTFDTSDSPNPPRTLVVVGFYGRGNSGDEAILQCIFEAFQDLFEIRIAVDGHGAYGGFWDWYPYTQSQVIHQTNVSHFLPRE